MRAHTHIRICAHARVLGVEACKQPNTVTPCRPSCVDCLVSALQHGCGVTNQPGAASPTKSGRCPTKTQRLWASPQCSVYNVQWPWNKHLLTSSYFEIDTDYFSFQVCVCVCVCLFVCVCIYVSAEVSSSTKSCILAEGRYQKGCLHHIGRLWPGIWHLAVE